MVSIDSTQAHNSVDETQIRPPVRWFADKDKTKKKRQNLTCLIPSSYLTAWFFGENFAVPRITGGYFF